MNVLYDNNNRFVSFKLNDVSPGLCFYYAFNYFHKNTHTSSIWFKCYTLIVALYFLVCRAFDSQSIAESKPSPFVADVLNIWNVRSFKASRPRAECTSATLIHPSISCLLANTTKTAPPSSSSYSIERERENKEIRQLLKSGEWSKGPITTYP